MMCQKNLKMKNKFSQGTMRFAFKLVTIGSFILMLSVAAYIIIFAIKGQSIESWSSMGVFAIGVAGIVSSMGYMKKEQKKTENKLDH